MGKYGRRGGLNMGHEGEYSYGQWRGLNKVPGADTTTAGIKGGVRVVL